VDKTNPECTRKAELQATLTAEPSHIHGIPLPHRRQSFAAWLIEKLSMVRARHL
jgi:hypothetical protein